MNLGRYFYETGSSAGLADWLALVDLGVVAVDQRRALEQSAVWGVQADVRARIASLAAVRAAR